MSVFHISAPPKDNHWFHFGTFFLVIGFEKCIYIAFFFCIYIALTTL